MTANAALNGVYRGLPSRASGCRCRCGFDDLGDFLRVRHKRHVARLDLCRRRADALGVEALELWIDFRPIFGRDDLPRWDRLPRTSWNRRREDRAVGGLLSGRYYTSVCYRDIPAEDVMELRTIDVEGAAASGTSAELSAGGANFAPGAAARISSTSGAVAPLVGAKARREELRARRRVHVTSGPPRCLTF